MLEILEALRFYMTRVQPFRAEKFHPAGPLAIADRYGIPRCSIYGMLNGVGRWAPELIAERMVQRMRDDELHSAILDQRLPFRTMRISAKRHLQRLRKRRRDKKYRERKRRRAAQ